MSEGVLIIGYGRAGKRHEGYARRFGLIPYIYDPILKPDNDIDQYLNNAKITRAVIASPPDTHLDYINQCLEAGLKVLCEKPLCGFGQLEEAKRLPKDAKVMVAYNYRYHDRLQSIIRSSEKVNMRCKQYRHPMPEWGLLLDHCSHDLDICQMVAAQDIEIVKCNHSYLTAPWGQEEKWIITLNVGEIIGVVTSDQSQSRIALLETDDKMIDIDPNPRMFENMWADFLGGYFDAAENRGLRQAIRTQKLLEDCQNALGR